MLVGGSERVGRLAMPALGDTEQPRELRISADGVQPRVALVRAVNWDPEGTFRVGLYLARAGDLERAVSLIDRAVNSGYVCYPCFVRELWLDPLRGRHEFGRLLELAKTRYEEVCDAFRRVGGEAVLGVGA